MFGTKRYEISSLNFIDLMGNSGPAINEIEFNNWLCRNCANVLIVTPNESGRVVMGQDGKIFAIGRMSIKRLPEFIFKQIVVVILLAKTLGHGALLYYRHSRLSFAVVLLRIFRPDVRLVVHRAHPAGGDVGISESKIRRFTGRLIEVLDSRLRTLVYRFAEWIDCVNSQQASLLAKEAGREVRVVMNGVNVDRFSSVPDEAKWSVRDKYRIPRDSVVIGYCGGFPVQRGARQIRALLDLNEAMWGIVIGKLSSDEAEELMHPRLLLLGEIPYEDVPTHVAVFDIAVAFDLPERSAIVGNSNQKIRQGLASGAWVLTSNSDIDLDGRPWLGKDVDSRDLAAQQQAIITAAPYLQQRQRRIDFARLELDIDAIFSRRHVAVISGCHRHV